MPSSLPVQTLALALLATLACGSESASSASSTGGGTSLVGGSSSVRSAGGSISGGGRPSGGTAQGGTALGGASVARGGSGQGGTGTGGTGTGGTGTGGTGTGGTGTGGTGTGGTGTGGASGSVGGNGPGGTTGSLGGTSSTQGGSAGALGGNGQGGSTETAGGSGSAEGGSGQGGSSTTPTFANEDDELLYLAVRFYGAERCGDTHNWTLENNPAGTTCHLRDGETEGIDVSGGWHDAGDHVKVTLTIAYAAYIMLKAYEVYGASFLDRDDEVYSGVPNGIPDVLDEARIGLDWLVKAHPDANRLVAMVGNTAYDHSTFMTSPTQSANGAERGGDPRPLQMGAKADFAGMSAAALALGSRVYADVDSALSATYLSKARSVYEFGRNNPGLSSSQLYAWAGSPYADDMLCGAAELWRTTSEASFLSEAVSYDSEVGDHEATANYSQISDFCRHSLVKGGEEGSLSAWKSVVDRYTTMISNDSNIRGLIYVDQWGTCRHAMAVAFSAALLYDVTGDTKYRDFALSQYAWVKGENPQSRSFVVGFGTNPPTRPHHRNAYGYEDDEGWDPDTPALSDEKPFRAPLIGALVGGPNLDGYEDTVNDYIHNEVALDYQAGLVGTAAFALQNR